MLDKIPVKLVAMFFSVLSLACSASAEVAINGADHIFEPLVGKIVIVEGLAWGKGDKGLGERLTLPYGEAIYLAGVDFWKNDLNGRSVRITGKLTVQHMKAVTGLMQGYTSDFDYYQIKVTECVPIQKVTLPYPEKKK
jgi:hypothetical protein